MSGAWNDVQHLQGQRRQKQGSQPAQAELDQEAETGLGCSGWHNVHTKRTNAFAEERKCKDCVLDAGLRPWQHSYGYTHSSTC